MLDAIVRNVMTPLTGNPELPGAVSAKLKIRPPDIGRVTVLRRSIDARQRNRLRYNFTLRVELPQSFPPHPDVSAWEPPAPIPPPEVRLRDPHPVIVGSGPAGLFCALAMVERGLKPRIHERGAPCGERARDVAGFWKSGDLNPESNVQFGEGGAGMFSDGKLTARNRNALTGRIYELLVQHGAPGEILIDAMPNLGTEGVRGVVHSIRDFLTASGCTFHYHSRLEDIRVQDGRLRELRFTNGAVQSEVVVLATGNGAADTWRMLLGRGVHLQTKPLAVGYRIEHPRLWLDHRLYGETNDFALSGPAVYKLTARAGERGVYTFCMCPGGEVIAATSSPRRQVVNGMSGKARDGDFSNSAVVATVGLADLGEDPREAIEWVEQLERGAFLGNHPYHAPAQSASEFMGRAPRKLRGTIRPGFRHAGLAAMLPDALVKAIKTGLLVFDKRIPGFIQQGVMFGLETRTSSPVRMERDPVTGCATGVAGLYPAGEGSGYAGGIVSSAADGYRTGCRFVCGQNA